MCILTKPKKKQKYTKFIIIIIFIYDFENLIFKKQFFFISLIC